LPIRHYTAIAASGGLIGYVLGLDYLLFTIGSIVRFLEQAGYGFFNELVKVQDLSGY
jgi:hypothetical protein